MTVAVWLRRWLASRLSLRAETVRSYAGHIEDGCGFLRGTCLTAALLVTPTLLVVAGFAEAATCAVRTGPSNEATPIEDYLVPHLGDVLLADLSRWRAQAMFTQIAVAEGMAGRPVSAATLHRIHATLRAALNDAVRVGLIVANPAVGVELPSAPYPHPTVWTVERIAAWCRDGTRSAVPVWTPEQTAAFLAGVRGHRLYALFHLVALSGLRRGEVCGLAWADVDMDAGVLSVARQRRQTAGRVELAPPKSRAGVREIALDHTTITALRQHRHRQKAERAARAATGSHQRPESGYVLICPDGRPLSPDRLTRLFAELVGASGPPPVTLHGLRHGAATMALAAGAGLKTVQAMLGHSSIQVTADIYPAVLPQTAHQAAESTAALLFGVRRLRAGGRLNPRHKRGGGCR